MHTLSFIILLLLSHHHAHAAVKVRVLEGADDFFAGVGGEGVVGLGAVDGDGGHAIQFTQPFIRPVYNIANDPVTLRRPAITVVVPVKLLTPDRVSAPTPDLVSEPVPEITDARVPAAA